MNNSTLEIRLTQSLPIAPDAIVVFDEPTITSTEITYDNTTGIITFNAPGQYSIKWWVSTETTLKGVMVFDLFSSQGSLAPGCSPIKTGQVSGFGVIDVEATGTTLSLINRSLTDTVLSRKTRTKAYLLITPIGKPSPRVYRGNLSAAGSYIDVPLGNGLYYHLGNLTPTQLRLTLIPMNGPTIYDYRRFCSFDGVALQGDSSDSSLLTGPVIKDADIFNNSREIHWVLIRVQDPATNLWSTYEVRFFASGGISRVTIWVNVIEEEVSY